MSVEYQVAIVGGGPVGLALAVELGQRGVSCVLVERHTHPQPIPKGQNLTNRSLEHFWFWRCVDQLRAARVLPTGYPVRGVTAYENLMSPYVYSNPTAGGPGVQEFYFQANERLPQYCTEQVLRDRLRELPSVTTLFGWSVEQIEQDDRGVRLTIARLPADAAAFYSWSADAVPQTPLGTHRQVVEAEYAVGCDGGRSLVRDSLGIDRGGRSFDQRMVLAVLRSRQLHDALERFPPCTTYRVLKPELQGYWQFFGRVDVGEGFFFHAPVPSDTRPESYDFLGLLQQAAGFPFEAEFDHVGFWDLRIRIASQYSQDRVFIAGDACHQHPPYGGFGLNTGLEDAVNLGWKLAAVLQGWGGQGLLASYGQERRPIFVETGEAMIAGGIERDRAFLERYNPHRNREEFEHAWGEMAGKDRFRRQSYEPHYAGSPIVAGSADGVCGIHSRMSFKAEAGHHLAPRTLSDGRNVFERLGDGFTLLALDAPHGSVEAIQHAAAALGLPLEVLPDRFEAERTAYEARLVLVRPDQYVVWSADAAPVDARGLLKRVSGQT
jgi:4-hydroxyisophthalate hydroxylase